MIKDSITNTTSETIDIINKVDTFYNSAWEKILIFGVIGGVIIGIVVPIIIQFYQRALLKQSEKNLEEKIENETAKIKEELKLEMEKQIQVHLKEYKAKLKKIECSSLAMILHKQASEYFNKGNFKVAAMDYLKSCANYIKSEKYDSVSVTFQRIQECISHLTIDDVEEFKIHNADINGFYKTVEESPINSIYVRDIINLKSVISKLPKRV